MRKMAAWIVVAIGLVAGCGPAESPAPEPVAAETMTPTPEAVSLLGEPLYLPERSPEEQAPLEQNLATAQANYEADPDDADNIIWLGRRLAYLWRYRDAVAVFTEGMEKHPEDPRLYRHRGHRYITLRDLDNAVADLERAAELIAGTEDEVEPDGQPNAAGIPTSTLHTNIWYHLGLAYYLQGDFDKALEAYQRCLAAADNNDMQVATLDWLYMTLRRLGRQEEAEAALAPIQADMELLENFSYFRRLLMYKGEIPPDSLLRVADDADRDLTLATQGYGVGNWYLYNQDAETAGTIFRQVLDGSYWPAFGFLAAEADVARMQEAAPAQR